MLNRLPFTDTILHRWLHVPYSLHVTHFRSPKLPKATVVLIHGMGNTSASWQSIARQLPSDVRVIGVDMLGFGQSPKPKWIRYKIAVQARSIAKTLVEEGVTQRPIIVGHSLGALVATELARRLPLLIKRLVLCSPPLYRSPETLTRHSRDRLLHEFYKFIKQHPRELERLAPIVVKLGLASKDFNIAGEVADIYVATLEASIMNQSSLKDVQRLTLPITILYGTFDPLIVGKNIKKLAQERKNIKVKAFAVGHEIVGRYQMVIADELKRLVGQR